MIAIGQAISDFLEAIIMPILNAVNGFLFEWIHKILPMNFIMDGHLEELNQAIFETISMVFVTGLFSVFFGTILGVLVVTTRPQGVLENKVVFFVLDKFINFFRSVPFVILIPLLMVVSRTLTGTYIGVIGTLVPLVFGTTPFFARQIESALSEVDNGLIEASTAMGSSPVEIIFRVYLKESIPSIVRGVVITCISLIGLTAMAGQVGGGGLGSFAIRYGYQRSMVDATWSAVIIILVLVTITQGIGNLIIKKTSH